MLPHEGGTDMETGDKKVIVEARRALIAKRLQTYRRAAEYLNTVISSTYLAHYR